MFDSVNSNPKNSIHNVPGTSTPNVPADAPETPPVTQVAIFALTSSKPGFPDPPAAKQPPPPPPQPPPPPAKKPPPPPPLPSATSPSVAMPNEPPTMSPIRQYFASPAICQLMRPLDPSDIQELINKRGEAWAQKVREQLNIEHTEPGNLPLEVIAAERANKLYLPLSSEDIKKLINKRGEAWVQRMRNQISENWTLEKALDSANKPINLELIQFLCAAGPSSLVMQAIKQHPRFEDTFLNVVEKGHVDEIKALIQLADYNVIKNALRYTIDDINLEIGNILLDELQTRFNDLSMGDRTYKKININTFFGELLLKAVYKADIDIIKRLINGVSQNYIGAALKHATMTVRDTKGDIIELLLKSGASKKQIGQALIFELKNQNKDVDITIINSFLKAGIEQYAMHEALCEVLIRILVSFSDSEMALNAGRTDTQTVKAIEEAQIKNKEVLNLIFNYVKNNDPTVVGQVLVSPIWFIKHINKEPYLYSEHIDKELYSEKAMQLFFDASNTTGFIIGHDNVIDAFQEAVRNGNEKIIKFLLNKSDITGVIIGHDNVIDAFHEAARIGNEEIIKFLLNKVESDVVIDVFQHTDWNESNAGVLKILTKKITEVEEEPAE